MKLGKLMLASVLLGTTISFAGAQSGPPDVSADHYVPRLADIMSALQVRHLKIYFAGRAENWDLADFELRQIESGLAEAAVLYSGIPVTNITTLAGPARSLSDAIKVRDKRKFLDAMGQLTEGCNSCHQAMGREFITIGLPTTQPFTNQVFAPPGKKPTFKRQQGADNH